MPNYDHDSLGVGNSQHPANQPEIDSEEEKDLTIREAMETGHEDLIYDAIGRQEQLLANIESELKYCIDVLAETPNTLVKNRLIKLLKTL